MRVIILIKSFLLSFHTKMKLKTTVVIMESIVAACIAMFLVSRQLEELYYQRMQIAIVVLALFGILFIAIMVRCPFCHKRVSVVDFYRKRCSHCGRKLRE